MKSKIVLLLASALAVNLLTACGYIKSLFPDKEKDYQYTTEIPALVLPPDLAKNDSLKLPIHPRPVASAPQTQPEAAAATPAVVEKPTEAETAPAPVAAPSAPAAAAIADTTVTEAPQPDATNPATPAKREPISVAIQKSAAGADVLRLNTGFETAWRAIDKALSRKSIEVTARNKAEKSFTLHYDPDEKALEDQSFWHETFFIFNSLNSNEQEFIVKLTDQGQQTEAMILDKEQKPATDASASRLLNLLQDTIKSDFAK
ncbi:MAG: outer membrane protein assembly factor BamC [Methylovulum miyakonense]|uniref:outer membrane protein assembly factor BamC n=1 Tax=Methylovulum miyakonense TaxID=645578 RepID=UPI003BB56431